MKPEPSQLLYFGMHREEWKVQALVDLQHYGGRLLDMLNPDWREELDGSGHTPFNWFYWDRMNHNLRDGLTALANYVLYLSDETIEAAIPEPEPVEISAPDFERWEYLLSTGALA